MRACTRGPLIKASNGSMKRRRVQRRQGVQSVPLFLLFNGLVFWSVPCQGADQTPKCTLCDDGGVMTKPDRTLEFFAVPVEDCGELDDLISFFTVDQKLCDLARSVGPYCGCPFDRETACSLCHNGEDVGFPDKSLSEYINATAIFPDGVEEFDVNVTCSLLQEVLYTHNKDEDFCSRHQLEYHSICGCSGAPLNELAPPSVSPAPVVPMRPPCNLCINGESVPSRDKPFQFDFFPGVSTCGELEDIVPSLFYEDDEVCYDTQMLGELCGCSPPLHSSNCRVCPNGEKIPFPTRRINWFEEIVHTLPENAKPFAEELTCELLEAVIVYNPSYIDATTDTDFVCLSSQLKSGSCGCSPDWKQKFLTWAYRGSGILSLLGSSFILVDVFRKQKSRGTAYHQLVVGMSFFDCVSSLAYALVGVMAPEDDGFYQSHGNDFTCAVQGFMIQLGLTSVFYNLFLAVYFYLVIRRNWKERQFKRYIKALHACLILTGVVLAGAAIPYYGAQFGTCYLLDAPFIATSWHVVTIFYGAPVAFVIGVVTVLTASICVQVYSLQKASRQWAARKTMELTRKVFWQSFFYVAAFYITLPFVLLSYYVKFAAGTSFWMFAVASVMAPGQGLMNALIYFQRTKNATAEAFASLVLGYTRRLSRSVVGVFKRKPQPRSKTHQSVSEIEVKNTKKKRDDSVQEHQIVAVDYTVPETPPDASVSQVHPRRRSSLEEMLSQGRPPSVASLEENRIPGTPYERTNRPSVTGTEKEYSDHSTDKPQDESGTSDIDFETSGRYGMDDLDESEAKSIQKFEGTMEYWRLNYVEEAEDTFTRPPSTSEVLAAPRRATYRRFTTYATQDLSDAPSNALRRNNRSVTSIDSACHSTDSFQPKKKKARKASPGPFQNWAFGWVSNDSPGSSESPSLLRTITRGSGMPARTSNFSTDSVDTGRSAKSTPLPFFARRKGRQPRRDSTSSPSRINRSGMPARTSQHSVDSLDTRKSAKTAPLPYSHRSSNRRDRRASEQGRGTKLSSWLREDEPEVMLDEEDKECSPLGNSTHTGTIPEDAPSTESELSRRLAKAPAPRPLLDSTDEAPTSKRTRSRNKAAVDARILAETTALMTMGTGGANVGNKKRARRHSVDGVDAGISADTNALMSMRGGPNRMSESHRIRRHSTDGGERRLTSNDNNKNDDDDNNNNDLEDFFLKHAVVPQGTNRRARRQSVDGMDARRPDVPVVNAQRGQDDDGLAPLPSKRMQLVSKQALPPSAKDRSHFAQNYTVQTRSTSFVTTETETTRSTSNSYTVETNTFTLETPRASNTYPIPVFSPSYLQQGQDNNVLPLQRGQDDPPILPPINPSTIPSMRSPSMKTSATRSPGRPSLRQHLEAGRAGTSGAARTYPIPIFAPSYPQGVSARLQGGSPRMLKSPVRQVSPPRPLRSQAIQRSQPRQLTISRMRRPPQPSPVGIPPDLLGDSMDSHDSHRGRDDDGLFSLVSRSIRQIPENSAAVVSPNKGITPRTTPFAWERIVTQPMRSFTSNSPLPYITDSYPQVARGQEDLGLSSLHASMRRRGPPVDATSLSSSNRSDTLSSSLGGSSSRRGRRTRLRPLAEALSTHSRSLHSRSTRSSRSSAFRSKLPLADAHSATSSDNASSSLSERKDRKRSPAPFFTRFGWGSQGRKSVLLTRSSLNYVDVDLQDSSLFSSTHEGVDDEQVLSAASSDAHSSYDFNLDASYLPVFDNNIE